MVGVTGDASRPRDDGGIGGVLRPEADDGGAALLDDDEDDAAVDGTGAVVLSGFLSGRHIGTGSYFFS